MHYGNNFSSRNSYHSIHSPRALIPESVLKTLILTLVLLKLMETITLHKKCILINKSCYYS
jgi:hypothetical protein